MALMTVGTEKTEEGVWWGELPLKAEMRESRGLLHMCADTHTPSPSPRPAQHRLLLTGGLMNG